VRLVAVAPRKSAGMWLPAEHFAVGSTLSGPSVQPNLPQPVPKNKTIGLVTVEGI
jgi:hypothetical protein